MEGSESVGAKKRVEVFPVKIEQAIEPEQAKTTMLSDFLLRSIEKNGHNLEDGDILIIASKVVSLFENRTVLLKQVKTSLRARILGWAFKKDPHKVELILREGKVAVVVPFKRIARIPAFWSRLVNLSANPSRSEEVLNKFATVFMVKKAGIYLDDAGLDLSNIPDGYISLLPADACASATNLVREIHERTKKKVAIIITDTASVLGKIGGNDVAIGYADIDPVKRMHGHVDLFGEPKSGGVDLVIDALAGMAGLIMGQTNECTPFCICRGYQYNETKELRTMADLTYPPGTFMPGISLTVLATLVFYLFIVLTFPLTLFKKQGYREE